MTARGLTRRLRTALLRLGGARLTLRLGAFRVEVSGPRVDPLTGLPDRQAMWARLDSAVRKSGPLAVLFLDLDHFKEVNDRHGHLAGDQMLVEVARKLEDWRGPADLVARFGGDEFIAILAGADATAAERRAAALLARLRLAEGPGGRCTASLGIATSRANADAEALLREADLALYQAKTSGRDCFRRYLRHCRPEGVRLGWHR